ncbi:hypothetical protein LMC00_00400 [Limosilactobacillus reuteri]|uniref:hypothetical protein n=1 Tax=Limosilactobacillus reuteri TaxID=1598 RepID=UPI001E45CE6A|nr:hypothetical protein [Limosilactobacillus reuteri]MCC4394432.1 hypothetical protein [Limosilactobacillus reuteri]MCC4400496.1 hypothetical protein [Limosilactobacillus reuteri]
MKIRVWIQSPNNASFNEDDIIEVPVKDMQLDDYGKLELIHVFEDLHSAQQYATKHPRAVILPREVIKHGKTKEQK